MNESLPGKGFFGWLGRQVGYVTRAINTNVGSRIVYREQKVQEANLPHDADVKLRRTTIDEVIVQKK